VAFVTLDELSDAVTARSLLQSTRYRLSLTGRLTRMIQLRPQPIGIYPFPAANLLLPAVEVPYESAWQALMQGDLDGEVPREWEFFVAAARGEIELAIELVQSLDCAPLATYNAFVLTPTPETYQSAKATLSGELRELLDVAAYAAGITDTIVGEFSLAGELEAFALATAAAADMEHNDHKAAQTKLKTAVASAKQPSPVLAAILLSQLADLTVGMPGFAPELFIQDCQEAIRLAGESQLPMLRAELHAKMGMVLQNASHNQRSVLLQAVNAYQSALHGGITEQDHPELFAQLQNNLGLAYLSMPAMGASDQLRNGIAVQSFRHALKVYTIESHPDMWASVSMNLANALQYAPTSHPETNLMQAVEIYEEVLQVRSRAKDPVAYALVLLNQANALAHLGMFKPALEKLAEAYKLFHWYDQVEQAEAARELVAQINQRMDENNAEYGLQNAE
jgi:tetratricopeptide (TPR) repeat protein